MLVYCWTIKDLARKLDIYLCQTLELVLDCPDSSLGFSVSVDFFFFFSGTLIRSFSFTGARQRGQLGAEVSDVITSIMHCWQKTCAQRVMTGSTKESRHTEHSSSTPEDKVTRRSLISRWVSWSASRSSSSESSRPGRTINNWVSVQFVVYRRIFADVIVDIFPHWHTT